MSTRREAAQKALDEAEGQAWEDYNRATAQSRAQALEVFWKAFAQAQKDYDKANEAKDLRRDEQRTIRITGLEGKVNLEDLHKGIYLIMGKPECVRVQIAAPITLSSEPSIPGSPGSEEEWQITAYQPVHFWDDKPTAAFWDSFVDVAAGEVIIADAWVAKQTAQARETYAEALVQAQKAYEEAKAPAREVYKKARAQAKKEESPDV